MTLEFVANEDLEVEFSLTAGPPDLLYSTDQGIDVTKIVPIKSTKVKANSKEVCTQSITLTFAVGGNECPFSSVLYNFVGGVGTITATATKTKAENKLVLREGDTGTCVGTSPALGWTLIANPFTPVTCTCDLEISDAGQTKIKAQ